MCSPYLRSKIFDKEELEPPHVTILRGPDIWRLGLRDGRFLIPPGGAWSHFPKELRSAIEGSMSELCSAWDRIHPENPVGGEDD